ncbi:MAG TPA: S8 family serine peptidase, partial [Bacteroidota bacterium]
MKIESFVAALIMAALPLQAQSHRLIQQPGHVARVSSTTGSLLSPPAVMDSMIRVIVEFVEEPLFSARAAGGALLKEGLYDQRFDRFAADLATPGVPMAPSGAAGTPFTHTYFKSYFGASLTVRSSQVPAILRLPYVKTVYRDRPVRAALAKSSAQMGVLSVWQSFGNQGEGVRVGIIDSGVDYLHPALGGGFGPGFKVSGGYDFVNGDGDPLDDEGHGTHVSGIVAAETDSIKGIAPKATLYVYKVLDHTGSGTESDVIAAIERAVDPDGNGDPSDRLDIVNLSLGSEGGSSTGPSSVAVDNASKLGVLFCIAAGNSGYVQSGGQNNFYTNGSATIGSPGTAESAVTVGAVDSTDQLAVFSSKGPNRNLFGMKPDVVAPGVGILSTVLNNGYERYNGTSMATPMVTGVAALLKGIHPDWSWDQLRSALVNTSRTLGISAFHQGSGRVQAMKAASATAWIKPTALSLGLDDPSVDTWTRSDTLFIHNSGGSAQTFTSSVTGLESGISLALSPSSPMIDPGDSVMIIVTTNVNNSIILTADNNIPLYSGHVLFAGNVDTLSVPWGFARTTRLTLVFNEPEPAFLIFGGLEFIWSPSAPVHWPSLTTAEVYGLAHRTYDILTEFASASGPYKLVFKSYAVAADAPQLSISTNEAIHPLVFHGVDHAGAPISSYPHARKTIVTRLPLFGDWVIPILSPSDTVWMSSVPAAYLFRPLEFQLDGVTTKSMHLVQFPPFSGMQSPRTLTNLPTDFISQYLHMLYPPGRTEAAVYAQFQSYFESDGRGLYVPIGFEGDTVDVIDGKVSIKGHFGRSSDPGFDAMVTLHTLTDFSNTLLDYSTLPIMISQDSILATTRDNATSVTPRSPSGGYMTFGGPPVFLQALWYNNVFGSGTIHFGTSFRGMQREFRYKDLNFGTYTVYDAAGAEVFSNPLNDFPRAPRVFSQDPYKVVMTSSNYWLGGTAGTVLMTSEFDLATLPANPPTLTSFLVLDSTGQPTHIFPKDAKAKLVFSALVINFSDNVLPVPDSTWAWYRIHGTENWISLSVQSLGGDVNLEGLVFKADLTAATGLDSVAIDLRVVSKDNLGYSMDFEVIPAFAVGDWAGELPTGVGLVARGIPH